MVYRKDNLTAATDLFSLYDFSIRKDAKVEKGYLLGRYGAIPFIHGGLLMAKGKIEKRGAKRRNVKPIILIVTEGSQT